MIQQHLILNNTTEKLKFISRVRPNGMLWIANGFCVECLECWKQSDVATCMLLPSACCCRALFRVTPCHIKISIMIIRLIIIITMIIILISSGRCCQLHVLLPRRWYCHRWDKVTPHRHSLRDKMDNWTFGFFTSLLSFYQASSALSDIILIIIFHIFVYDYVIHSGYDYLFDWNKQMMHHTHTWSN